MGFSNPRVDPPPWLDGVTNGPVVAIHERLDALRLVRWSCKLASPQAELGASLMKDPALVPLAAWIGWEMFFDEPEPTSTHRTDDDGREPPDAKKTAPRSR